MLDRTVLSNGLTVIYQWTPQDPIGACHLFFPNGSMLDPVEKSGLTTLHWSLFVKGSKKRSAQQIAEDIEMLGASMGAGATYDYSEVSCHAPFDEIQSALQMAGESLFQPLFDENEIAKEKIALQAAIRSKKESIFTLTHEALSGHLYPKHPYGRPSSGTETSVGKISKEDLLKRHKQLVHPKGALLAMAANIPFKTLEPYLENFFGAQAWPSSGIEDLKGPSTSYPEASKEIKNSSHFEQAYLMMGFPAAEAGSKDYIALKVLNGILGGGMSTRLFQTLREKEGLAYDVGSFYATKKFGSSFVIHMGLQASRMSDAKHGILRELDRLKMELVPDAELAQVKNQMKGSFILDHQTNSQRAHYLGWWEILGLGADFDQNYPSLVDKVTSKDIQEAALKYFNGPCISVETVPKSQSPNSAPVSHAG